MNELGGVPAKEICGPPPGAPVAADKVESPWFVPTSLLHVLLAALLGELASSQPNPTWALAAFVVVSKLFAIVYGESESLKARFGFAWPPLGVLSVALLATLSFYQAVLGAVVLLLYATYPVASRSRRVPADLVYHGGRYLLLFLIGFGLSSGLPLYAAALGSAVFFLGASAELVVGERRGRGFGSGFSAASVRRAVAVVSFACMVAVTLVLNEMIDLPLALGPVVIPVPLVVGVAASLLLVAGVRSKAAFNEVRKRESVLAALLLVSILAAIFASSVNVAAAQPAPGFSASVDVRTLAAGRNSWDVPWVTFDYHDAGDYCYVVLHKGGLLELSQVVNGTRDTFVASAQTSLSPFDLHLYNISQSGQTVSVSVDGREYVRAEVSLSGGTTMVSSYVPIRGFWLATVGPIEVGEG